MRRFSRSFRFSRLNEKFYEKLSKDMNDIPLPKKTDETYFRRLFQGVNDITFLNLNFPNQNEEEDILLFYFPAMIDKKELMDRILPRLEGIVTSEFFTLEDNVDKLKSLELFFVPLKTSEDIGEMITNVCSGKVMVYFQKEKKLFEVDISNPPQRAPEESGTEVSIRGPKDGFIEEIGTNLALIRKRLMTNTLLNEQLVIGKRSKTKVSLIYMKDIIDPEIIKEVKKRLKKIDVDVVSGASQIKEYLFDQAYTLFPLLDFTQRPDFVVASLVQGRFAISVDGDSNMIIGPINLMMLLKSPEDLHMPFYYVSFERLLRLFGLFIAIFLPGFYVALAVYNIDQIPTPLLATIIVSRVGLPFSAAFEAIIMLLLFELFKEGGIRLPKAVGHTVAVVGGLIIGDAAIRAGITSPSMLVVAALSVISAYTLVNQGLVGIVTLLRFYVLFFSATLGIFGFFISIYTVLLYLSRLTSFGVPYLAPLTPSSFWALIPTLLRKPWRQIDLRPSFLNTKDNTKKGDEGS